MEALDVPQVFVPHVQMGYEDRRRSMEEQLGQRGIAFEFMLAGDIPDLTAEDLARFEGWLIESQCQLARRQVSCAVKHLRIYEEVVLRGLAGALVLEDDIQLAPQFVPVVNRALREAQSRKEIGERFTISFENSMLHLVPRTARKSGQLLYPADHARCLGAYYVSQAAAADILQAAKRQRLNVPIDHYHTLLCQRDELPIYWCHPPVAEQGSMNGRFASAIDPRRGASLTRRIGWSLDKCWKQLVSQLR